MDPNSLVLQYLSEAHATESALVTNLKAHIAMTTDAQYKRVLERHLEETQAQVSNLDDRRSELGESGGKGFVAGAVGLAMDALGQVLVLSKGPLDAVRTTSQQERMLKNARDECATEAIEIALYDALEAAANAAGDAKTAKLAVDHRKQEERMLADLRTQIGRLAVSTFEDKTEQKAKAGQARRLVAVALVLVVEPVALVFVVEPVALRRRALLAPRARGAASVRAVRPPRARLALPLVVLAAAPAAGCGSTSKADAVNVARTWLAAVQHHEYGAACKLMRDSATRAVAAAVARPDGSCPQVLGAWRAALGDDALDAIAAAGLEARAQPADDQVTVEPKAAGHERDRVLMQRDGGRWAVAGARLG